MTKHFGVIFSVHSIESSSLDLLPKIFGPLVSVVLLCKHININYEL